MWPVTSHLYKRATRPGLPAGTICTQLIGRKLYIKFYILWRLHCPILTNFWSDERDTSQNLSGFYFHNSWIYVETMTQNVNFSIWPVQYLACQTSQRMYKVKLIVNKVHIVFRIGSTIELAQLWNWSNWRIIPTIEWLISGPSWNHSLGFCSHSVSYLETVHFTYRASIRTKGTKV